jgi:pimeloyl-ACP methyl ester carboxylesterase
MNVVRERGATGMTVGRARGAVGSPASGRLAVADTELAWTAEGDGSPVLLVHGLGSSQEDWGPQVLAFQTEHHVIRYDQRGHGASARAGSPFTMVDLARDAAALIRALDVGPCHVVGLSLGGMVAFELALAEPKLVRSLVIVNSGPEVVPRTARERLALVVRRVLSATLPFRWLGALLGRRLFPYPGQKGLREDFVRHFARNHKPSYLRAVSAIIGWSVAERIASLAVPTLVVSGDRDYTGVDRKLEYVRRMPRASLQVVADSGHATPVDQPEAFNGVVSAFLRGVDAEHMPAACAASP